MNPKINTFSQDISTLKGDISSILKVYTDHHSCPEERIKEGINKAPNNIPAFTRQRINFVFLLNDPIPL